MDEKFSAEILLKHDTQIIVSETITSLLKLHGYQWKPTNHEAVFKLFLRRSGGKGVTKAMLQQVQNLNQMNLLFVHRPRCPITSEIVEAQQSKELMALLLEHEPDMASTQVMATQLLKHRKRHDNMNKEVIVDVLQELWGRNSGLRVTEAMFENMDSLDPDTMQFLLSHSPPDLQLSQGLVLAAGANWHYSLQVLRLLLQHRHGTHIEEDTVAGCRNDAEARKSWVLSSRTSRPCR
ncbi:hypothetical protein F5B21DRAFT_527852 [Xylaria acuta]|nr:hypothetical protein F5B21DRAFT_527852 [Xylaria acuta]